jgi:hypothetical protein
MRYRGYGVIGHGSAPSHRLPGGDEAHNPENQSRLKLRDLVPRDEFLEYVSDPGGYMLWFQGPSGLWYTSGRTPSDRVPGHFVHVWDEKYGREIAWLCMPLYTQHPLASIAQSHYLAVTTTEAECWGLAVVSLIEEDLVPDALKACIQDSANHHCGYNAACYNEDEVEDEDDYYDDDEDVLEDDD